MRVKRSERGWIAHFICADRCRFRRNTLLECGEVRIVVSTVGAFVASPTAREFDTVGHGRYFETMAFRAKRELGRYWDADVSRRVAFRSPWSIPDIPEDADDRANRMHEAVVAEIAGRLRAGGRL